jgi:membrane protease YdiL (CAAX protease family)
MLGVWATFGWALLAFVVSQAACVVVVLRWFADRAPGSVAGITYDGTLVAIGALVGNPIMVVLLAAIARWRTGTRAADYLGLTGFTWRDFLVGFAVIALLAAAGDMMGPLLGIDIVPPFQTEVFTSASANGWLWPLVLAIVLVGPAGEEVLFRGFLFRGWVGPGARGVIAVAIISLLWALMHVQYAWIFVAQIFVIGLVLGWIRWRSGSALLTTVLHILINLESTVETLLKLGWISV